ncbi:MAG: hypothetical protein Q9163_006069 [Psora crenata]
MNGLLYLRWDIQGMVEEIQAAPPLLGSTLLASAEAHGILRPLPASSGSLVIDESALQAASHLLTHVSGEVVFIDTAGSCSPIRLRDVLVSRLNPHPPEKTAGAGRLGDGEDIKEANSVLDRVKVMRVFDLAGIAEAVSEVADIIERDAPVVNIGPGGRPIRSGPRQISDSEDELAEAEDSEIEPQVLDKTRTAPPYACMVIIDAITNVVSSAVAKNQLQGQALLASLMRTLQQLTCRHHICTIIVNGAVGMQASRHPEYQRRPNDCVSIFASTLAKPALGKTFSYHVDTSVFLSIVPKTKQDATSAYGGLLGPQDWRRAVVLEVLKDKTGAGEGRWAAFEIVSNIKLVPC